MICIIAVKSQEGEIEYYRGESLDGDAAFDEAVGAYFDTHRTKTDAEGIVDEEEIERMYYIIPCSEFELVEFMTAHDNDYVLESVEYKE